MQSNEFKNRSMELLRELFAEQKTIYTVRLPGRGVRNKYRVFVIRNLDGGTRLWDIALYIANVTGLRWASSGQSEGAISLKGSSQDIAEAINGALFDLASIVKVERM